MPGWVGVPKDGVDKATNYPSGRHLKKTLRQHKKLTAEMKIKKDMHKQWEEEQATKDEQLTFVKTASGKLNS